MTPAESAMKRIEVQSVLFAERPSRLSLLDIDCNFTGEQQISVNVWRNHAVESVLQLARPYFYWGVWQADFRVGDYDDSLSYAGHSAADVELLWLDSGRYAERSSSDEWIDWLLERIRALRAMTSAPIVIASWLGDAPALARLQSRIDQMPAVYFADLANTCEEADVTLLDRRTAAISGTPLGNAAQLLIARKLACHWLPSVSRPPIKAVALDLDHTLHAGVLGEDGIDGVQLTEEHRALQAFAKDLRQRGIFIALVSRNEQSDVEGLFAARADYPLRWEDFSATEVSWGDKASAIVRIAEKLRIAPQAILFVDDNPGELASVSTRLNEAPVVHASSSAALTLRALQHYPGLWQWKAGDDDTKRVLDLQASAERESMMARADDPASYFRSLGVSMSVGSIRLTRWTGLRICATRRISSTWRCAVSIASKLPNASRTGARASPVCGLHDRLSDSGTIAVIVAERAGDTLIVEELCVSCRALGRRLEDTVILTAIRAMPLFADCTDVAFRTRPGPRNQPALDWLGKLVGDTALREADLYSIPTTQIQGFVPAEGVALATEP